MIGSDRTTPRRSFEAGSALIAAVLLLGGCSSSGTTASSPGTSSPGTSSSGRSSATTSTASGATGHSSAGTSTTAGGAAGGASASSFCGAAAREKAQALASSKALASSSPTALRNFEEQAMSRLPALVALAPAAIKADVQVVVRAEQTLFNDLRAAGFDASKLTPATLTALGDPAFEKAGNAITRYLAAACGISSAAPTK